jgi:hypothetical protein
VGKALRRHTAFGQPIVADRGRGLQTFVHIVRIEQLLAVGVMTPYPGQAISLELHRHRQLIRARTALALL